jgi:hypothetical protein
MFGDTESEGTVVGEVTLAKFEVFDLEALLQDLLGTLTTDGDGARDLLVTTDVEVPGGSIMDLIELDFVSELE